MTDATARMTETAYWQTLNRKSLLRFFLFSALAEKPMHGYELADAVSTCSDGVRPTDAMIYPTLKELEANGYIVCRPEAVGERRRNVCTLTEQGLQAYRAAAEAWSWALPKIETAIHSAGVTGCCDVVQSSVTDPITEVTI
jgi:PadR family transcriptional regulator PadR